MTRRDFIKSSAFTGGSLWLLDRPDGAAALARPASPLPDLRPRLPNLSPARWIWYPSGRCLQNTFVLFRREIALQSRPRRVTGWIAADSRYRLEVNGQRVQWGPAPCDPRWAEADPMDLTTVFHEGLNVLGATVLFYGQGDGTWPLGKAGFLFWLEIEHSDGSKEQIVSDSKWLAHLARAWPPGHYKRWYLRALQEEFDARSYPYGWTAPGFVPGKDWLPAMSLQGSPNQPSLSTNYPEYMLDIGGNDATTELRPRSIPLMSETLVPVQHLSETHWFEWLRPPEEYFECRVPSAFRATPAAVATEIAPGQWQVALDGTRGAGLTFEFAEQIVGWPFFTIEAPAGTVVEVLVHEAHRLGGPPLLNTHFESWSRFICRDGLNRFETFDFESLRWLQLHIRNCTGSVTVREIGVRRRVFPWPNPPAIQVGEPGLQRLLDASINTLNNCAQETCVDGMARERQQYSGDGGHQLHGLYLPFGETRLPARFLTTFSQGMTLDGFFLDCWPAYDRLARLIERQFRLSGWGPILDHGVGFNFDCWHYYNYTGDLEALKEPYPRLLRFAQYLHSLVARDGLLPVENLGIPSVWIDHVAYQQQRHKQCAFNLYAAAMLQHALAPICQAFGDVERREAVAAFGGDLLTATVKKFWSRERGVFVNNLPWLAQEKAVRLCDRSLATAILFGQCPGARTEAALRALVECPPEMGFSYPCNAGWRLWALACGGRADVIVKDLRERWATMDSVKLNNTLQEDWRVTPDSGSQWSHCAVAPLYLAYTDLAGIRPLTPGFRQVEIRPQLGDLEMLELTANTVQGPIRFAAQGQVGQRELALELPAGCVAELVLRREETVKLERAPGASPAGHVRYQLPPGRVSLNHLTLT